MRDLAQSKSTTVNPNQRRTYTEKKQTFGIGDDEEVSEDGLGSSHEMLENSSNSMVNMAISLDPLTANRMMGQVDQRALQRQKDAMAPLLDKMNIGRLSTVESGVESGKS